MLVDRAGMKGGTLLNYTSDAFRRTAVSNAVVGYQFVTSHPHGDAALMADRLRSQGYDVSLVIDPDPNIDPGKMAFIRIIGLLDGDQQMVYVFRRHKFRMEHSIPASWSKRPSKLSYAP